MTARVFAVCNQKGGVGKTTTTFHLARAAVTRGKSLLLVDNDSQGNLTSAVAGDPVPEEAVGLANALSSRTSETIKDVTVPTVWAGVDLVPTTGGGLSYVRDELVLAGAGREMRLREALAPVRDDYDLIFIDCPPNLDQLTINGLSAATDLVIVTHPRLFGVNGLAKLLKTVATVRSYYNPELTLAGVIINQDEMRTVASRTWTAELAAAAERHAFQILQPSIPKRVVIGDTPETGRGLDEWGTAEATTLFDLYLTHFDTITKEHQS